MTAQKYVYAQYQDTIVEAIDSVMKGHRQDWPMSPLIVEAFGERIANEITADVLIDWMRASLKYEGLDRAALPDDAEARRAAAYAQIGEQRRDGQAGVAFDQLLFAEAVATQLVKSTEGAADRVAAIRSAAYDVLRFRRANDHQAFVHPMVVKRALDLLGV